VINQLCKAALKKKKNVVLQKTINLTGKKLIICFYEQNVVLYEFYRIIEFAHNKFIKNNSKDFT